MNIFAIYITSSDINASLTITGGDIQTGGPGYLYAGTQNVQGRPVTVPSAAGQIWIGQLANQTPITNVPIITVPSGGPISPTALALATNTTGFDGTNFISGIYSANSIGKILVDGTVTGNVAIEGSVGTFYAGWLLTGDATGAGGGVADNFNVTGDIANLLVHTSVGTEVTTVPNAGLTYDTFTQIHAGGKIGTLSVGDCARRQCDR